MIEKIKTYKYGYKCIAMLLVFALSLNMLAGCGKSGSVNNTVQDEYKTENTAPEKIQRKSRWIVRRILCLPQNFLAQNLIRWKNR